MNARDHTQLRRVLFVDDDHPIRFLAAKLLQRGGYQVDTAPDGYVALEKLQKQHYDLVILDLMMPRVTGYDVIRVLPTIGGPVPPVIVLTALPREQIGNLNSTIVRAIVEKPVDVERFLETIGQVIHAPQPEIRFGGSRQ